MSLMKKLLDTLKVQYSDDTALESKEVPHEDAILQREEVISDKGFDTEGTHITKTVTDSLLNPTDRTITVEQNSVDSLKGQNTTSQKLVSEKTVSQSPQMSYARIPRPEYVYPPIELLKSGEKHKSRSEQEIRETATKIQYVFKSFNVHAIVANVTIGLYAEQYSLLLGDGVRIRDVTKLSDEIKLALASDIKIETTSSEKPALSILVPIVGKRTVMLREIIQSKEFQSSPSKITISIGRDALNRIMVADIAELPHLLIGGTTGSGKSVFLNTLIMSILFKASPEDVNLLIIDPNATDFNIYSKIPHLLIPVVNSASKATGALKWAIAEMTDRYAKFSEVGVRTLTAYNAKIESSYSSSSSCISEKLPEIIIVMDKYEDLMNNTQEDINDLLCQLAQHSRAAGIHLIISVQRPSVNIVTGSIKANIPSKIAFTVTSGIDSKLILDTYGAEKLEGNGDMLFFPQGIQKPIRVQGAYVSEKEIEDVVNYLSNNNYYYHRDNIQDIQKTLRNDFIQDDLFVDAGKFIIEKNKASIGMLQRIFKINFYRASRIMDQLSAAGVVGSEEGTKPRKILMSLEQFEAYVNRK